MRHRNQARLANIQIISALMLFYAALALKVKITILLLTDHILLNLFMLHAGHGGVLYSVNR